MVHGRRRGDGLTTIAFHATGGGRAALALAVHALAILATPSAFCGGWVLTRRLAAAGPLSELALAFYGRGAAPQRRREPGAAKVLVAASSIAIGFWSMGIVRTRLVRRGTGVPGCIAAAVTLLILFTCHLTLDVHGFGAVVLGQAIWLILVGAELRGTRPAAASSES